MTGKSNSFVKLWILIGCVHMCMCWHVCLFFHTFMSVANLYFVISKIIQIICECALNFHIFVSCVLYVSFSSIFFICGFYINSQFSYRLGYVLQLLNRHVVCRFRAILYVIFFFRCSAELRWTMGNTKTIRSDSVTCACKRLGVSMYLWRKAKLGNGRHIKRVFCYMIYTYHVCNDINHF